MTNKSYCLQKINHPSQKNSFVGIEMIIYGMYFLSSAEKLAKMSFQTFCP